MEYDDFMVQFAADGTGGYRIEARCDAAGEAVEKFTPPYSPQELASCFWALPAAEPGRDLTAQRRSQPVKVEEMGYRLFEALMPPPVRSCFSGCVGAAGAAGRGVRIKLRLDPTDPHVAWLGLIPWEAACTDRGEFLGLSRRTPISRYLDAPHQVSPAPFAPPLRILAAMAQPHGVQRLDLPREYIQLRQSWSEGTGAEVDPLERATLDTLRERLCQRWDIFHFMGHGGFDADRREGYLVFEDEDGNPRKMRDESLAILLQGAERPRLVVLNACETARTAADSGPAAATGAAPMLVRAGIPAVAAMLHPISDRAAILFNKALHSRLAAGDPVDVAVAEGRRAIHGQVPWPEWAKPVLFMRVPDGRLFASDSKAESSQASGTAGEMTAEIREIEAEDIVLGGVVCEGGAAAQSSPPGKASLQADRTKARRFVLGGSVHLAGGSPTPKDGDPA